MCGIDQHQPSSHPASAIPTGCRHEELPISAGIRLSALPIPKGLRRKVPPKVLPIPKGLRRKVPPKVLPIPKGLRRKVPPKVLPIPKGLSHKAQGCEERATLGKCAMTGQPQRGCGIFGPWAVTRGQGRNPVGVVGFFMTVSQGRRDDTPTLGFVPESRWDWPVAFWRVPNSFRCFLTPESRRDSVLSLTPEFPRDSESFLPHESQRDSAPKPKVGAPSRLPWVSTFFPSFD